MVQTSALPVEEVLPAENLPGSRATKSRISTATGLAPQSESQILDGCCVGKVCIISTVLLDQADSCSSVVVNMT